MKRKLIGVVTALILSSSGCGVFAKAAHDPRNIEEGHVIATDGYCDMPYVVITDDNNWLCTLTRSNEHEGAGSSQVVSTISKDQGHTWSPLVELESVDGPESAYSLPIVTPEGRVYVIYNYNGDNFRAPRRSDELGWFVFRYSDDNGHSWSAERYRLPMRMTQVDRTNTFNGEVQLFWGISKPIVVGTDVFFAFTKIGQYVQEKGEGWFYRSANLLTELDPNRITWELLPEGDIGLKNDALGIVQEEHNIVALGDGSLYCIFRTENDSPGHSYSRDGGRTWSTPVYATYSPSGGPRIKNPRVCPRIWKTESGHFLLWYHHHGRHANAYRGRNPAWLSGGIEKDGFIHWSQPEVVLYDPNPENNLFDPQTGVPGPTMGPSYPDLIEQDGRYWISETQKTVARVHEIDPSLLHGLWNQTETEGISQEGLLFSLSSAEMQQTSVHLPPLPRLEERAGFTIEMWIEFEELEPGQVVLDSRSPDGRGVVLTSTEEGSVRLSMSDGKTQASWACDPELLQPGELHHVAVVVDAGPRIITFVVDGKVCDGGLSRVYGWGRFSPLLVDVNGSAEWMIGPSLSGTLRSLRIYERRLPHYTLISHGRIPDCNSNSVPDLKEIAQGDAVDDNDNAIPDDCEPDRRQDGLGSDQDIMDDSTPPSETEGRSSIDQENNQEAAVPSRSGLAELADGSSSNGACPFFACFQGALASMFGFMLMRSVPRPHP